MVFFSISGATSTFSELPRGSLLLTKCNFSTDNLNLKMLAELYLRSFPNLKNSTNLAGSISGLTWIM